MRIDLTMVVGALGCICATLGGCASKPGTDAKVETITLPNYEKVLTEQRRGDWCWAACCEMALKYNGVTDVTQETLVQNFKGSADDQTAIDSEIITALATTPENQAQTAGGPPRAVQVRLGNLMTALTESATIYSSSDSAVEDFCAHHPVIMGLKDWEGAPAHIVFLTSVQYVDRRAVPPDSGIFRSLQNQFTMLADKFTGDYRYYISGVDVYDPMPGTGGMTHLTPEELAEHLRFFLSRKKAVEIMHQVNTTVEAH